MGKPSKRPGREACDVHAAIRKAAAAVKHSGHTGLRDAGEYPELAELLHACREAVAAGEPGHDSEGEGATFAHALLERIGAGASSPAELASLMQFLHSGPMLHGACAAIYAALVMAAGRVRVR